MSAMNKKLWFFMLIVLAFSSLALAIEGTVMIFPDLVISTPERYDTQNDFPLPQLADRDLVTTWTFKWDFDSYPCDWDQDGIGSWIKVETLSGLEIRSLEIVNGYAKMWPIRYEQNNAVMSLIVEESSGNKQVVYFDDDCQEFQDFKLKKPSTWVKLTIDDVRYGNRYNDTCIGEMAVYDVNGNDLVTKWPYYVFTHRERERLWEVRDLSLTTHHTAEISGINWAVVSGNAELVAFYGDQGAEVYDVKKAVAKKLWSGKKVTEAKFDGRKLVALVDGTEQTESF